jgi:hypothetical protein
VKCSRTVASMIATLLGTPWWDNFAKNLRSSTAECLKMQEERGGGSQRLQVFLDVGGKTGVMCGSSFHLWVSKITFISTFGTVSHLLLVVPCCSPIFGELPLELYIQSISCSKQKRFPTKKSSLLLVKYQSSSILIIKPPTNLELTQVCFVKPPSF